MREEIKARIEAVRRGEVPEGYKTVIPYVIPQDWQVKKLGSITKRTSRPNKDGVDRPAYSINNRKGFVPQSEQFEDGSYQDLDKTAYKIVRRGEFAYNPARVNVGSIGRLREEDEVIVSSLYVCVGVDASVDGEYFDAWTKTRDFFEETVRNTEGSVREYLFYENFANMRMPIPPLAEQQKIAEILSTCDRVIELKQQLLDEKRRQKQWLMQMLLDPDSGVRLPGFEDEWSTRTFNDICVFINGRAYKQDELLEVGKYPVLRVGNLFTKSEWYYSDMELPSHMYIDNGDLIYAWSASFGPRIWQGNKVIFHYHIWKVMPSEYVCKEYLYQYFQYDVDLLNREQQGGTMAHITKETMEKRLCRYPTLPEQKRISEILNAADRDIALTEQELEAWQQKKKALMQLLLTGLVRVNA